jgi:hypothetical protein
MTGLPRPPDRVCAIELITLLADRDWLDDATKTIGQYWRRKNARRNGLTTENQANLGEILVG